MRKSTALYGFCMALILMAGVSTRCGSMNESGGGGGGDGSSGSINLIIKNPDPNSSGTAKAVLSSDIDQSKTLTKPDISTCTLTISASDISTINHSFSVASGASTVTTSLTVPPGSGRTFAVDCSDSSGTTNNITVGYKGSTSADVASGENSISLSPQFKNLISDDSSGVHFMRLNQENATQTRLTIGFGSVLTDQQKIDLRCILEFDTSASRTSVGVIDANRSDGLTTSSKSGPYILITGGSGKPAAFLYNSSDSKVMKLNPSWTTTDAGNTMISATFGITQLKNNLDSNEAGQYAGACSLTGSNPYDVLPNSGYANYVLDGNSGESDVASLISNGSACSTSRSGETCSSGFCSTSGECISITPVTLDSTNADVSGFVGNLDNPSLTYGGFAGPPLGLCITPDGQTIYVMDTGSGAIDQVTSAGGTETTFAGGGSGTATDGTGTNASFNNPQDCVIDPTGTTMYVADSNNCKIRKITLATTAVTTFAGSPAGSNTCGNVNGTGTAARFNVPWGLAIDSKGENLYVADESNYLIRKITIPGAVVTTVAGTGSAGSANGAKTAASFNLPKYLTIDSTDTNLYVTDSSNNLIRKIVIATGDVTTLAGSGVAQETNGIRTAAAFNAPSGIKIDPTDTFLYVATSGGLSIRKINISTAGVTTIAGNGSNQPYGTGLDAGLDAVWGLIINPTGNKLFILNTNNNLIQMQ